MVTAKNQDAQMRQRQTLLAESTVPVTETSGELREVPMDGAEITSNCSEQKSVSFNSSVRDTVTTFLETETLRIKEDRRLTPSRQSRFLTISPTDKIVTVGICRGPPSSVGSSINAS